MNPIKIKPRTQTIDRKIDVNPPWLNTPSNYAFSGAPGKGKSTMISSIYTEQKKPQRVFAKVFDNVFYICPLETYESEMNDKGEDMHPFRSLKKVGRVFHEINPTILRKILVECRQAKLKGEINSIIIDDFSEELKPLERILKTMLFKHRHYALQVILSLINLKSLSKSLRPLINCYILYEPTTIIEVEDYCENIFGKKIDEMKKIMEYVYKEKHDFLFYQRDGKKFHRNSNELVIT